MNLYANGYGSHSVILLEVVEVVLFPHWQDF